MGEKGASTPRWLFGTALALPLAMVVGVLIAAGIVRSQDPPPLPLVAVPAPMASSANCARLLAGLPQELDGGAGENLARRELAVPIPPGTAAWGEPPVVLRCGLGRPAELTVTARLLEVSGVQFLKLTSRDRALTSWVAVDRPVYVVVTLPAGTGSGPLQQLAEEIRTTLAPQELDLPR